MLKKSIIIVGLFSSILFAKVNTVVSILPELTFVQAIGGDKVNVSLMVKPGYEPHEYEPKPSQMKDISKADIYFSIGVEFEESWLPKFSNQNKKMKIVDLSSGIVKIEMAAHHHAGLDPHIWLSPMNAKLIAKNILFTLVSVDVQNKDYYTANYKKLIANINNTDKKIRDILISTKLNTKFMVFHPAFGYFARDYGLTQFAIEAGGKEPKPKQMIHLINEAKEENIKALFIEPEFSAKAGKQIASAVGIPLITVSPLNSKWGQNLINLARAIANK